MFVSGVQQRESTVSIHISSPSWTSLTPYVHTFRLSQSQKGTLLFVFWILNCLNESLLKTSRLDRIQNNITKLGSCRWNRVFPGGSAVTNLPATQETWVWFLGWKILGEEDGNPLQSSCLGNLMDRGAWWVAVHRVKKSQTQHSNETT